MAMEAIDRKAFDELAGSVALLTTKVEEWRRGDADRQTVERIAGDVLSRQKSARRSYIPDTDAGPGEVFHSQQARRLMQAQGTPAGFELAAILPAPLVADTLHRPLDDVQRFQEASDGLAIAGAYLRRQASDQFAFDVRDTAYYREVFQPAMQALDTATTAEGVEYVPRELSGSLIDRISLQLMVAPLFVGVQMPTNPFDIPGFAVSRQKTGKSVENTADTGQTAFKKLTPATRKVTLTAAKLAVEVLVSRELEEDSLIAMLPFLQQEIVDYISADIEDAIINGDTAGTMDTGWTATIDPRLSWDGLRKSAIAGAKTSGANAALTAAMLRTNRGKMGKYGIKQDQLAHIISMASYIQLLTDTATLTLEKYGPNAVVLTGEAAKVDGIPVIVSEFVRQDLNASGVFDNVTTNRSAAITVNTRGFFFGNRREMTVQVLRELYAEDDQDAIVASVRKAFTPRYPAATEPIVAVTYNLST